MANIKLDNIKLKKDSNTGNNNNADKENLLQTILTKDIKLFGNKLSDKKKQGFYSDMFILLSSGIDIKTTLELICDEFTKKNDALIFNEIRKNVIEGKSLSEAIKLSGKFSDYEIYSVKIGEESGRLNEVLKDISDYYSRKIEQKKKLVGAFSYPALVMMVAILAVVFMLNYIVPMFQDVFKRFNNKELPYITQMVINISAGFSHYFSLILLFVVGAVAFLYSVRKKTMYRNISSRIMLKLPLFGQIVRKIYLARFCFSMELLTSTKVPILTAIQLQKKMVGFYPIEHSLEIIENDILHGKPLHESMKQFPIYDRRIISLIKVAEEVNQLDVVFGRLKNQYNNEIDYSTTMISSILEPLMIIFVGAFVAMILIAMYLPMFQLSTSFAN
ncbi:MAG: type II secretion system F family protein [Bacteroidales bacterium]|jgi:type IV pilus assembly protein PilC